MQISWSIDESSCLTKKCLAPLATMACSSAKDGGVIQRNMHGRGVVRAAKRITLTISNKDIDDAIRITKLLKTQAY